MTLPFDTQEFLAVFARYNEAIWPLQVGGYLLGLAAIGALFIEQPARDRVVQSVLAVMWAWNGLVYHLGYFASINPAAVAFAALFMTQAALFALRALQSPNAFFEARRDAQSVAGIALILYATVIYEVLSVIGGHGLMSGPLFAVAPCPTTIFTIGLLLLARGGSAVWLALIPLAWAVVGTSAAVYLGIGEDVGLGLAGLALAFWIAAQVRGRPKLA
jgi:hypothetical protein